MDSMSSKTTFYKTFGISVFVSAMVMAGVIGAITINYTSRRLVSTSHYHFNVQYRAGNVDAMYEVINNSLYPLLRMYERHPTWKANIEFQSLMLEFMNQTHQECLELLKKLVIERRQIQLVVIQYSDALALAYPYIDFYKSIVHTRNMLGEMGFINATVNDTVSRAVLLQEGQFMLGFSRVVQDFRFSTGRPMYDTLLTTRESLSYFGVRERAPLYTYTLGGQQMYVLPYNPVPQEEAGTIHHVLWFQDGENVNSGEGQLWEAGGLEDLTGEHFPHNPIRQANHEARLMDLEAQGNEFLHLDEWVAYLIENNQAKPLDRYVPETHWQPFNYRSSFIWMGETKGDTKYDDNEINARNYHTRQQLLATEILLNHTAGLANTNVTGPFLDWAWSTLWRAWMDLAEAEVTDSTGLGPREIEGETAILKTAWALANASLVRQQAINVTSVLNDTINQPGGSIQVIPGNLGTAHPVVVVSRSQFVNFTTTSAGVTLPVDAPFTIHAMNNDSFGVDLMAVRTSWSVLLDGLEYYSIKANFPRTNTTAFNGMDRWSYFQVQGNFSEIAYSPSLWEHLHVNLTRSTYNPDEVDFHGDWKAKVPDNFQLYLPLANGLLYSRSLGVAIVKNCSTTHLAARWKHDMVRFMQTETRSNLNPAGQEWEYFVLPGVTIQQAVAFANLVNSNATVIFGGA